VVRDVHVIGHNRFKEAQTSNSDAEVQSLPHSTCYKVQLDCTELFYILMTVHLDVILVNDQLDALFSMYLFHASTCFEQQVLIIRRIKLCQYIIWYNPLECITPDDVLTQFDPPADKHLLLETCRGVE
jgi:hypothetical protein